MKICRQLCIIFAGLNLLSGCLAPADSIRSNTLVYCSEGMPATLNPQQATGSLSFDATVDTVYETLITFDAKTNTFRPKLATSWSVSDDGKHYTFHLRQDVQFHHAWGFRPTRPLTAQDVIFSFRRQLDTNHPFHHVGRADYPYFQTNRLHEKIKDIVQIDPYTVEFILTTPVPNFLTLLSMDFAVIQSAEYADYRMEARRRFDDFPIGTGPLQMTSYKPGFYLRFKKFEQYWGTQPNIDQLVFAISPASSIRLGRIMTGECDLMSQPQPRQLAILKNHPNIQVSEYSDNSIAYWAFNVLKPKFSSSQVRKALAMAIDRQRLVDVVYAGTGIIAQGFLPNTFEGYKPVLNIRHDFDQAREILKRAGWDFDREFNILAPDVQRSYNPNPAQTAQLIQYDLAKIGIKAKVHVMPWPALLRRLNLGQYDTVVMGWRADNLDTIDFLYPIASCAGRDSGTNRALWCHPKFDALITKARKAHAQAERITSLRLAQELLAQELPWLPLVSANRYIAHRNNVHNIIHSASGRILFKQITKERR